MTSKLASVIPDSECLVLPVVAVAVVDDHHVKGDNRMKVRVGIDTACRSPHHAAIADETDRILSTRHRFRTVAAELDAFWELIPEAATEVLVVMEPTRNAWVPLAASFRRHGAQVVIVPSEQSADLRDYMSKHTKTDRLDAELLARLPVLHPEGLHPAEHLGPGDPLKRAVKIRAGLVHRRIDGDASSRLAARDSRAGMDRHARDPHDPDHLQILDPVCQPSPGQTSRSCPAGPLVPAPHPQSLGSRARPAHDRRWERNDRALGQRWPRLRSPGRRHRRRGHHRAGGLRTDRPVGPPDPGPLHRSRPDRNRAVRPWGSATSLPPRFWAVSATRTGSRAWRPHAPTAD